MGMLVRGAGEGFNLMVPMRRIYKWAAANNMLWAVDPDVKAPTIDEIRGMSIETIGLKRHHLGSSGDDDEKRFFKAFPYLIRITPKKPGTTLGIEFRDKK